ncbi:MbnP family protein [Algibacter sp. 2305UL17-15]|uniref:MbnP family protein n=1 Tax=Algibacter sp. 2305UL17-15 TaxID=3231268 RepID=UPI0034582167
MKKFIPILLFAITTLFSCNADKNDTEPQANIIFNFSHSWDGTPVTNTDFNQIQYTNENGEVLSISKLRYIISNIIFTRSNGEDLVFKGYNLVDVTNETNLAFLLFGTLPLETYSNVSFTFGLNNEDNAKNYQDLNSASWIVPEMLGGGYHYMQLEGKFVDNASAETGYAYHVIRAVDNSGPTQVFQDTFFEVDLGEVTITNTATFNVEMNIAEWFKNPNTWNLNVLNNMLMPNYDAQVMMFQNGQNVFSLKSVTQ